MPRSSEWLYPLCTSNQNNVSWTIEILIKNPFNLFNREIPKSPSTCSWLTDPSANSDGPAVPHVYFRQCAAWVQFYNLFTVPRTPPCVFFSPCWWTLWPLVWMNLISNSIIACGGSIWHGPSPQFTASVSMATFLHCARTIEPLSSSHPHRQAGRGLWMLVD